MMKSEELLKMVNEAIAGLAYDRHPSSLYAPIQYVLSLGGKRIRPVLMLTRSSTNPLASSLTYPGVK